MSTGNKSVESARRKLSKPKNSALEPFEFDNLPLDRNDKIWDNISKRLFADFTRT